MTEDQGFTDNIKKVIVSTDIPYETFLALQNLEKLTGRSRAAILRDILISYFNSLQSETNNTIKKMSIIEQLREECYQSELSDLHQSLMKVLVGVRDGNISADYPRIWFKGFRRQLVDLVNRKTLTQKEEEYLKALVEISKEASMLKPNTDESYKTASKLVKSLNDIKIS